METSHENMFLTLCSTDIQQLRLEIKIVQKNQVSRFLHSIFSCSKYASSNCRFVPEKCKYTEPSPAMTTNRPPKTNSKQSKLNPGKVIRSPIY